MNRRALLLIVAAFGLTGCVTGRRTFELPINASITLVPARTSVYIASVSDDRHFQNKPSDPSIPSIDGDVAELSAQQRDRMIGRQRNTWGKALGDVSLPADDSVTRSVRLLVQQGLARSGYQITANPRASNSIAISIRDFWGWMTPGFVALTFEAKITCVITASSPDGPHTIIVKGYGLNHGQFAKDENWLEAFEPAFDDFMSNLAAQSRDLQLRGDDSAATH